MIPNFAQDMLNNYIFSMKAVIEQKVRAGLEREVDRLVKDAMQRVQIEVKQEEDVATNTIRYTLTSIVHPGEQRQ